jgi:hypothetical protein
MNIVIVDLIGLEFHGDTLKEKGLGGSESAVIHMSRELQKLGLEVTIYCKCNKPGVYNGVLYRNLDKMNEDHNKYDIMISMRSCVPFIPLYMRQEVIDKTGHDMLITSNLVKNSKYKVVWMHDIFCIGDDYLEMLLTEGFVNEVFTLSDWHTSHVSNLVSENEFSKRNYAVIKNKIFQTRNGVACYIDEVDITKKDKNLFVYNASITKGMEPLLEACWPRIKELIPSAKLIIVGGYYKWPNQYMGPEEARYNDFVNKYEGVMDIHFKNSRTHSTNVMQKLQQQMVRKAASYITRIWS